MEPNHSVKAEEETLAVSIQAHEEELHFQLMMAELVEQLQGASSLERHTASLHKVVARFGGAHFFYNQKGDFCLLTDFLNK